MHNSLLHLVLRHSDFLNTDISQGSVATRLRCGGVSGYQSRVAVTSHCIVVTDIKAAS